MSTLSFEPIDVAALGRAVIGPERGGVVSFVGLVRNHHEGREVVELEYSAYGPMAERTIAAITDEVQQRWPVRVAVAHRLGRLAIGEAAVAVVVAGGHRGEAFEGCRYAIEEVKRRVPIWKREKYADGSEAWVDPTAAGGIRPTGPEARG